MMTELERQRRAVHLAVVEGRTRASHIASRVLEQTPPSVDIYRAVDRALQWLKKQGLVTFSHRGGWKPVAGKTFPS